MPVRRIFPALFLIASIVFVAAAQASATPIELFNPNAPAYTVNGGNGRGILFTTSQAFSITSIGIHGNLIEKDFDIMVFSGSSGGSSNLVASTVDATPTVVSDGNGTNWNDIALSQSYSFSANQDYIVLWRPSDGDANNWVVNNQLRAWRLSPYYPSDAYTISQLTMTSGRSNMYGQEGNHYAPRMRFNALPVPATIPEPATFGLLTIGAGLFMLRRRTN